MYGFIFGLKWSFINCFNGIPPSQNIGIIRYIIYVNSVLGLGVVGRGGGG